MLHRNLIGTDGTQWQGLFYCGERTNEGMEAQGMNFKHYEKGEGVGQLGKRRRIYLVIVIVGLSVIGMLGYGFYTGDRLIRIYAPLVDAAMEIKLEATLAHLWFEEIISGDRQEDVATVWARLDQADWYAKAMLEGGKNEEGTFFPLDNTEMRQAITEVRGKLARFQDISKQRLTASTTSGPGTQIDQHFDAVFKDFFNQADEVETRLQQVIAQDVGSFRHTQLILIAACLMLFLFILVAFSRFDRRRVKDFLSLRETHVNLEKEMSERKKAESALQESERELKLLSKQLLSAEENERKRIARELHEGIGQTLSGIKLSVENTLGTLRNYSGEFDLKSLEAIIPMAQKTIEDVRRIVKDLRPSILDVMGVLPTISWVMEEFQKIHSDIRIKKDITVEENEIAVSLKTVIFRILQETLSNIAKHSRADNVRLCLKKSADRLELVIEDNGVGFDVSQTFLSESSERGFGLASMRERTELSEGTFTINSAKGKGTALTASWHL
jgi:signal transduction histidine kinase